MTIKMPRNLMTAISVVAFAVMLHGCGGGGGSSPVATMDDDTPPTTPPTTIMGQIIPSGTTLTLPPGHGLQEGTLRAKMGDTVTLRDDDGNVVVSGTCNDVDCSADLTGDVVTIDGKVELLEANAFVLALLTDLLPPAPTEMTELETAQTAAMEAATAARTAAMAAGDAADAAEAAVVGRATIQTSSLPEGERNSVYLAGAARMHADIAATAATTAEAANEMAAEATTVTAAVAAQITAKQAQTEAEAHLMMAGVKQGLAETAAATEVFVGENEDGDATYSVGETTIAVDDDEVTHTLNKVTTTTGKLATVIDTKSLLDKNGAAIVAGTNDAAALDINIGVQYDSEDDGSRLTLVTAFLGKEKQKQFVRSGGNNPFGSLPMKDGSQIVQAVTSPPNTTLTPVLETGIVEITSDHDGISTTVDLTASGKPKSAGSGFVFNEDPKTSVELYYIDSGIKDTTIGKDDDGVDQTRIYLAKVIDDAGAVTYRQVNVKEVTVNAAAEFDHISYGVWAGLDSKGETVAELGTGFVSGSGPTEDMPNFGTANYSGNWVGLIQEQDLQGDGEVTEGDGVATMSANFLKAEVGVGLVGLATLEGSITDNTFSGTKVTSVSNVNLDNTAGKFSGEFSGGFYGSGDTRAQEAGGVFNFGSASNKAGAFVGAFGVVKQP